jgi:hypothetical protein
MINLWKTVWKAQRKDREEGVAMVMAILITLVLVTLVASMTAFAMMGLDKGKDVQGLTAASSAADNAISHALTLANSKKGQSGDGIEKHIGIANAVYGSIDANEIDPINGDGQYSWRWYAEQVIDAKANLVYDIYASGYQNSPDDISARNFRVRIDSTVVEKAEYTTSGTPFYVPTMAGVFAWGAFGSDSVIMKSNSNIKVYDAAKNIGYPSTSLRDGEIATNSVLTLNDPVGINTAVFLNTGATIDPTRCTGTGCTTHNLEKIEYGMSLSGISDTIQANCPLNSTAYTDWKASANAGKINDTVYPMCYNNIIFDQDTDVSLAYSTGRPAFMYAKGNITVEPGVEVNTQPTTSQGPLALRIYSQAGTDFIMKRGTTANPTKMTALVAGPSLNCNIGQNLTTPNPHGTALYGSMACKTSIIETGSEIWWDGQLAQVTHEGSPTSIKLWQINSYQEI